MNNDIHNLKKDLRTILSSATISRNEARYLVDTYYQMQDFRIRSHAQARTQIKSEEPSAAITLTAGHFELFEEAVKEGLRMFSLDSPVGTWSMKVLGIGPVIAAGLLAHIDIEKAPSPAHIWSFAGLNPTAEWKKGEKRPWNASLKRLTWIIGESFVKVSGKEKSLYGKIYRERKEFEIARNDEGVFEEQAQAKLEKYKIGKSTDAYASYSQGKLPPAHIHARAKRKAVKIFLAHWHEEAYRVILGKKGPVPWALEHGGHVDYIEPEVEFDPPGIITP